jgi:hypothetical protein
MSHVRFDTQSRAARRLTRRVAERQADANVLAKGRRRRIQPPRRPHVVRIALCASTRRRHDRGHEDKDGECAAGANRLCEA